MNALLNAIAQRRTASIKPAVAQPPKQLSPSELAQVAGGAPRGTWSSTETLSALAPRGTW
jgi:hypothetical protein